MTASLRIIPLFPLSVDSYSDDFEGNTAEYYIGDPGEPVEDKDIEEQYEIGEVDTVMNKVEGDDSINTTEVKNMLAMILREVKDIKGELWGGRLGNGASDGEGQ